MKRIYLLVFLFLLICPTDDASAQIYGKKSIFDYSSFGIRAGLNFQGIQSASFNKAYNPGVTGGIYIRKYWKKAGFRLDVLVSTAHYTGVKPLTYGLGVAANNDTLRKADIVPVYLNAPLLFEYKVHSKVLLQAGMQYSYLLSVTDNTGVYKKFVKDNDIFNKSEFSAVLGADYKASATIRFGARYLFGLSDINGGKFGMDTKAWTTSGFQVAVSCQLYKYYGQ